MDDAIKEFDFLNNQMSTDRVNWSAGIFIPINKPIDWTSFDVVNKIRNQLRRITGKKKIKVGHAGTLDPRATGLLILACGAATKQIQSIVVDVKRYEGTIQLGFTTPTFDSEMEPDKKYPIEHITPADVKSAATHFQGRIKQRPPIYSAIKKNGKRLYQYARKDQTTEIPLREVEIFDLKLMYNLKGKITFSCTCSKGTYIRSLANDIGEFLNSGAYLADLVRTAIGPITLDQAWDLEDLIVELSAIKMNSDVS